MMDCMNRKQPSRLCPFRRRIEREYNGETGKITVSERFAPCAGERCMAHYEIGEREMCRRLEAWNGTR